MGSIAVDKGIAKIGSPSDFYQQLEPEQIAEQILTSARGDIRDVVERIMQREHPQLWNDVPAAASATRSTPGSRPSSPTSSARSPTRSATTSTSCST